MDAIVTDCSRRVEKIDVERFQADLKLSVSKIPSINHTSTNDIDLTV
jgi:hypothetical protein